MKLSSKAIKIKRNFVYRHQLTQYPRHCRDADTRTLYETLLYKQESEYKKPTKYEVII